MASVGHNSAAANGQEDKVLINLIERVERLEEEKKAIGDDVKDVYEEGKAKGYDVKTMKRIVALRKKASEVRKAEAELLELYAQAVALDFF
jgi:uncharacterized protein (UPF0335 family)